MNAVLRFNRYAIAAAFFFVAVSVRSQAPTPDSTESAQKPTTLPLTIESLAWLEGCWRGAVNQREFREYWLPLQGSMLVGAGHTVMQDKTQDYDYMRVEVRPDGIYYVVAPSGKPETSFKLAAIVDDGHGTEFSFAKDGTEFPQRIVYRRGSEGWLYATVEGKLNGEDRKVTYPMRRIVCESGELIHK
ncbi:MAG TPA: DUF6265 family protein [Casimicrobiaceae bacterium]|jgi:hypothetical protein